MTADPTTPPRPTGPYTRAEWLLILLVVTILTLVFWFEHFRPA